MADPKSGNGSEQAITQLRKRSMRERALSMLWTYLRGWVIIAVVVFLINLMIKAASGIGEVLEPFIEASSRTLGVFGVAILLAIVPWAIGGLTQLVSPLFREHRSKEAFEQMEKRFSRELAPDESHGFRVGLINYPREDIRSIGIVTATYREPGSGRQLASLFLPGTPDPTKGSLRTVAVDDVTLTNWTLRDLIRYHLTFGSASPDLTDDKEAL